MSVVNPNKHWEVQSYGMIIKKGEIMVNREKLETIVYVFEGKFYVELWDNGYLLHFQEMLGDWNIINSRRDDYKCVNVDLLRRWKFRILCNWRYWKNSRIVMRSGGGRGLIILSEIFNHNRWHTLNVYIPKFCPECGRKLEVE